MEISLIGTLEPCRKNIVMDLYNLNDKNKLLQYSKQLNCMNGDNLIFANELCHEGAIF